MPILMDIGPDVEPRAMIGDKGYASKANREAARTHGAIPVIPHKSNEKHQPAWFARTLYRGRARIEQAVGKLKRFKRIALRCEKTKRNFASFVALAAGFILVKSVHTAYLTTFPNRCLSKPVYHAEMFAIRVPPKCHASPAPSPLPPSPSQAFPLQPWRRMKQTRCLRPCHR